MTTHICRVCAGRGDHTAVMPAPCPCEACGGTGVEHPLRRFWARESTEHWRLPTDYPLRPWMGLFDEVDGELARLHVPSYAYRSGGDVLLTPWEAMRRAMATTNGWYALARTAVAEAFTARGAHKRLAEAKGG